MAGSEKAAHVLVAGPVHQAALDLLEARGDVGYELRETTSVADLEARIAEIDALVLRLTPLQAETIAKADRLKVVARFGVGYDNVDVDSLTRKGIPLAVVGEANSVTVAEHALALLLACARHVPRLDKQLRQGEWNQSLSGMELKGKTLGLIGFGGIGARFAEIAQGLGMSVKVWTKNPSPERAARHGVEFCELDDIAASSDVISLHLTSSPETEGFIDAGFSGPRIPT